MKAEHYTKNIMFFVEKNSLFLICTYNANLDTMLQQFVSEKNALKSRNW